MFLHGDCVRKQSTVYVAYVTLQSLQDNNVVEGKR